MTSIIFLRTLANNFLTERNWWQFHNPKNDAINILVESCELLEHFVHEEQVTNTTRADIADEMADVIFGILVFAVGNSVDISEAITTVTKKSALSDQTTSYNDLRDLVINNKQSFNLERLTNPRQAALALVIQASELADLFIWPSGEQSRTIAQNKKEFVAKRVAYIFTYLVQLEELTGLNAATEFVRKMKTNAKKYPIAHSSGEDYAKIKDVKRRR
jgi:NTP pyrophosphatase (non-canonical NTP hydrolase)